MANKLALLAQIGDLSTVLSASVLGEIKDEARELPPRDYVEVMEALCDHLAELKAIEFKSMREILEED